MLIVEAFKWMNVARQDECATTPGSSLRSRPNYRGKGVGLAVLGVRPVNGCILAPGQATTAHRLPDGTAHRNRRRPASRRYRFAVLLSSVCGEWRPQQRR